jgi:signal transduction histidine kinase
MLHEFIVANRGEIIERTRARVRGRSWPSVSTTELEFGVPAFLTQLSETLRLETTSTPFPKDVIGNTATRHGAELLQLGFSVSQVVHDYADICQVVTELALEQGAPVTIEEFHTLNWCLDSAIADAVTEHTRISVDTRAAAEIERLGHAAHELRDVLNTAILSFHVLKRGAVAVNGSTGAVLGRSLMSLRDVVDRTLSEVRLATGTHRRDRLSVVAMLDEIAAAGMLHSEYRHVRFTVAPSDASLAVFGDPQLLTSAVMNLLHNAFKNTPAGGHVVLRSRAEDQSLFIEIEDQCGGIPVTKSDLFEAFGERRGPDRSGLGLGLSIARKAVRSHGGEISIRNMPGAGCIFIIKLPLALEQAQVQSHVPVAVAQEQPS